MSTPLTVYAVDERDSQWESDASNYRVFIYRPTGEHEAFNVDDAEYGTVTAWAQEHAGDSLFAVALRVSDPHRGEGLIWLVRPDTDPDERAKVEFNTRR